MTVLRALVALLVSTVVVAPAAAQDRFVPTQGQLRASYAPIDKHVQPAVVNVYAAKIVQNRNPFLDDPIFRRFFGAPVSSRSRCSARSARA